MATPRTLKLSILADVAGLSKGLNQGASEVQGFGSKIADFGKKAAIAFAAVAAAATAFAVKFGKDAINAASDLSETISKTGVLFGDSAKEVEAFAATAAGALGQSKQQALDAAATFATFGKSAGLAGDDLVSFSTDFVSLASDLASFNNTSPEQAITAIGSALRGESEPLRAYGVLLDDATLRQAALKLGIVSTTKDALTPQQKVLAAQKVIYDQTGSAQGDFARTADGLANSQRVLSAQIENVTSSIGMALLPAATALFGFIGSNLIPVIQEWSSKFSESLKPAVEDITSFIQNDLLPIIQTWWGFMSDTVIPGILNYLTPILKGLKAAFSSVTSTIKDNQEKLAPLFELFKAVAGFVSKYLAPVIGNILGLAFNVLGKSISGVITIFANLVGLINAAVRAVKALASALSNSVVGKAVGAIAGGISGVFGGGRAAGGAVSGGTSYLVGERGAEIFTPSSSGRITPNGSLGGATYNITVNGALDGEGVARQIVDILNRSQARGTQGASNLAFTGV